jgi:hypothetical protein
MSPPIATAPTTVDVILSRAQRAHTRLSWEARLARNVRNTMAGQVRIKLFGVPVGFATFLGLAQGNMPLIGDPWWVPSSRTSWLLRVARLCFVLLALGVLSSPL